MGYEDKNVYTRVGKRQIRKIERLINNIWKTMFKMHNKICLLLALLETIKQNSTFRVKAFL